MASDDYLPRTVEEYAFDEALTGRHMVFVAGPRQVGKTRLARHWLAARRSETLYYNWDDIAVRQAFRADSRFFESAARTAAVRDPWIVFDEIHKRNHWRDLLKGVYDVFGAEFRFVVTGSARLDLFRRSGDSLVGRYNLFHMMPFSLNEVMRLTWRNPAFLTAGTARERLAELADRVGVQPPAAAPEAFRALFEYGPFPEPFLRQNDRFSRKWHQDYLSLLVREDLRDVSRVTELDRIEHLLSLLPDRIMSPLSMANLAREIDVAHTTVKSWLEQLRRLYLVFPVAPWSRKVSRGLKREKKWYFLDWTYAPAGPARLENLVATSLHGTCQALTDMGYGAYQLHYLRTLDRREIDFVVVRDRSPILAVEVKTGEVQPASALVNRHSFFEASLPGIQVVDRANHLQAYPDHVWVMSPERFLSLLV
jgi:predicted AAA+ superfamily ATPase